MVQNVQIISAPSILGLKPTGVEELGKSLLQHKLSDKIHSVIPVIHVPDLNELYSDKKDPVTLCLNVAALHDFSVALSDTITKDFSNSNFKLVLGGDCSIMIGVGVALKSIGTFGLIYVDAHADFYLPRQTPTGEAADMDLAIITGRGPSILTSINAKHPYFLEKHVFHVGQRDEEETMKYGAQLITDTSINCYSLKTIRKLGIRSVADTITQKMQLQHTDGYWIHFDTDVLSDDINPAVDYRLPGGLQYEEVTDLIKSCIKTGKVAGMTVTIFNPKLDPSGKISRQINECIADAFNS